MVEGKGEGRLEVNSSGDVERTVGVVGEGDEDRGGSTQDRRNVVHKVGSVVGEDGGNLDLVERQVKKVDLR